MDDPVIDNLTHILDRIASACKASGRPADSVKLLLATKTVPADRIKTALLAGQTLIGENKVQEIRDKYEVLQSIPHQTHYIGHLQTNKIKDVLKYNVSCIQSLDRIDLAEKLEQRLALEGRHMDVFIQVNTSFEDSKFGVAPEEALNLIRQVALCEHLHIKGLMTIGLFSADNEQVRKCFRLLKGIQLQINSENIAGVEMTDLSMGMSGDLEIAIQEGATIVRVGTAIFGQRIYPDSYYWNEGQDSQQVS
ncbi:hypothetical protein SAMN04487996_120136 [Dyadobacter soli]|uniref:Pyridoxal phosphate homeostasis protein n=1 Tax=Dyadobacter soli TaxID=659014 RepID=A0A1G7VNI8_9BACT|nr:YggS family pyridoxal phosphate-dependent enzyme [Dyadobacter soli]SDG61294.1 hypothetical protein SAMN04487996_120136 [Dyadobacter soli]